MSLATVAIKLVLQCPVCQELCDTHEDFEHHLWALHLFHQADANLEHYLSWKDKLVSSQDRRRHFSAAFPWDHYAHYLNRRVKSLQCDHCSFNTNIDHTGYYGLLETAHPTFLRPTEEVIAELHPYRWQILRLYPDFHSHPIFHDFDIKKPAAATVITETDGSA